MRLYMKIFLWYLMVMLLVGGALVFTIYKTQSELFREGEEANDRTLTPPYAERWAAIFEKQDYKAMEVYNAHAKGIGVHVYLYSDNGKEEFGQTPPPETAALLNSAMGTDETQTSWGPTRRYVAQRTKGPSGRHYILLVELISPFVRFFSARLHIQAFRVVVVALLGGLFCLWLARYITAPITELRHAARELARGNLNSRIGNAVLQRNDELADLSRDFNLMAERIESLMSSQRRLIQSVSHELRSPLARLNVALGIAYRHADPQVQAPLERMEREAGRLNDLVGDLLKLARWEVGIGPVEKSTIDLEALVLEIAADADFEARSLDREVCVRSAESCSIEGVRELLSSAIENVMRNAVKYTRPETEVGVTLERFSSGGEMLPSSACAIMATGFQRKRSRACSSLFTASPTRENAPQAGRVSDLPLPKWRSGCTADKSRRRILLRVDW